MNGFKIIIAFVCGFFIAQTIKFIINICTGRAKSYMTDLKTAFGYFCKSGGMPSGHSASFIAATTVIGFSEGFYSSIFALAVCTTAIVIYDAVNVRYVVGEQGKALNKLIKTPIRIAEGHTILEVFVGGVLGLLIGWLIFVLF